MKKIILFLLMILLSHISSAQTGWGYVNYTSYKTHNGNGSTTQYAAFPNNKAEMDNFLNTANTNTTITHTGEVPFLYVYNGSTQTPHWNSDFYAIKFEFWFVPQETGTYRFAITSDDASDLLVDGVALVTYYGGHGAGAWQIGQKDMVAGQKYKIVTRYQEYSGGDALYVRWSRPSNPTGYSYWNNEVTNADIQPAITSKLNFYFGGNINPTQFSVKNFTSNGATAVSQTPAQSLGANGSVNNSADFNKNVSQTIYVQPLTSTTLQNLYTSIVTVGDAYNAFQELANRGLTGSETGQVFTSGVQFMNGDVDANGVYDEKDSYKILQQVLGTAPIVQTWSNDNLMRLVDKSVFDGMTKVNWNTTAPPYRSNFPLTLPSGTNDYIFNIMMAWKGDVNLSHTPTQNTPTTNSINSMNRVVSTEISSYIETELVTGKLVTTIKVNPLGQKLKGVQFKVNYDTEVLDFADVSFVTKGNPQNFANKQNGFVSVGSIITGMGELDESTEYRLIFTPKQIIKSGLGLITIQPIDAVNVDGTQLKIKLL